MVFEWQAGWRRALVTPETDTTEVQGDRDVSGTTHTLVGTHLQLHERHQQLLLFVFFLNETCSSALPVRKSSLTMKVWTFCVSFHPKRCSFLWTLSRTVRNPGYRNNTIPITKALKNVSQKSAIMSLFVLLKLVRQLWWAKRWQFHQFLSFRV